MLLLHLYNPGSHGCCFKAWGSDLGSGAEALDPGMLLDSRFREQSFKQGMLSSSV